MSDSDVSQSEKISSLKGLSWQLHKPDDGLILSLMNKLNVSEMIARIIVNRNIKGVQEAKTFLNPKLQDLLPDPFLMLDMDKAVARVLRALNDEEKITVFADYDVDGATSSALIHNFFRLIDEKIEVYIPNRFSEGYGPNKNAFDKIKSTGTTLLITVDCGSVAFEPLEYAKKIGLDVIVVDHHVTENVLPPVVAMLNPNRFDETFEPKTIAAVGVTFFFLVALRKTLRETGWFIHKKVKEPDMMPLLDIVALGTVCDLMPLHSLNRAFVKHGLRHIAKGSNPGIIALMEVAKVKEIQIHHLGFTIGPRINAGGRLYDSSLGFKLLTATDKTVAKTIATRLDDLNKERRTLEALILTEAAKQGELSTKEGKPAIVVISDEWHIGVLGIIASRLKDQFHKLSVVIAIDKVKGTAKASVRSIQGVDVAALISKMKEDQMIIEGGGHAMAGGFSMLLDKISTVDDYINDAVKYIMETKPNILTEAKKIAVDAIISVPSITRELFAEISKIEPFGMLNPKPVFIVNNAVVKHTSQSKGGLWFIMLGDKFDRSKTVKCLCFNNSARGLEDYLTDGYKKSPNVKLLGTIQVNTMDETEINFVIEDIYLCKK